jgi:AraC-like DNA-binding protein
VAPGCDVDVMFDKFLRSCRGALRRIAAHTRGEHSVSDVEGEAWLLAEELRLEKGLTPEFGNLDYQEKILSFLYHKLVRRSELNVRYAVRLDHAPAGAPDDAAHPLLEKLAADEGLEPLAVLIQREESSADSEAEPASYESPAAAYLQLLRRFDNKMLDVATHLLISRSWCYRRFNQALNLAKLQWPLAKEAFSTAEGLEPSPWRKFRAIHVRRQLELDIDVPMLI